MHAGRAIKRRIRSRRIGGDHAAQRGPRTGGHIRAETKPLGPEEIVQLIQHDARADADGAAFGVKVADEPVVPGEIDDQPIANRSPGESRAGAPGNDRHARLRRRLDDGTGLGRAIRKGHRQWHNLVRRGVRGVELPRQIVKGDLAICRVQRGHLLGGHHSAAHKLSASQPVDNFINPNSEAAGRGG